MLPGPRPQPNEHRRRSGFRRALITFGGASAAIALVYAFAAAFGRPHHEQALAPAVAPADLPAELATILPCTPQQPLHNATTLVEETAESEQLSTDFPGGKLARRGYIVHLDEAHRFLASPSITRLPSGRLLLLYERQASWGHYAPETLYKYVHASDDRGKTWQHVGLPGPMQWPQIFTCASGTYIIGCEQVFSVDNNVVITRMEDEGGAEWSKPVKLTEGYSVVTINSGVDVSYGRVTKALEVIPSMAKPVKISMVDAHTRIPIDLSNPDRPSWRNPPTAIIVVKDATGFVEHTLVKVPYNGHAVFFRVTAVDAQSNAVSVRLERFTLFWQQTDILIQPGAYLMVGSGSHIYGGVDWVSLGLSAPEHVDLRNPKAWTISNGLGNPASLYPNELRLLFDTAFRGDYGVRKSILGFDHNFLRDEGPAVWEAGFGSLYWMEGVVVRLQDRRGGTGQVLNVLRVNNDNFCDLAALAILDDRQPGVLRNEFLRYKNVPGLAIGHPAIVYDNVTDLYWMASNLNRDPMRAWRQPRSPSNADPKLHATLFSKCEVDRSTVALYYSGNAVDWIQAGIVDYHLSFGRHFTYPHMIVDGNDLLVVMRATYAPGGDDRPPPLSPYGGYYNNHNSNAISFHKVKGFRRLANVKWATYGGAYTGFPRRLRGRA